MELYNQLEALKLLKDWSTWLVTVQAASLALMSTLWGKDAIKLDEKWARVVFLCFGASIVFATLVLGGLPSIAQRLRVTTDKAQSADNIYSMQLFEWLPDVGWLTRLWFFTFAEHVLFLAGICAFVWAVLRSRRAG